MYVFNRNVGPVCTLQKIKYCSENKPTKSDSSSLDLAKPGKAKAKKKLER